MKYTHNFTFLGGENPEEYNQIMLNTNNKDITTEEWNKFVIEIFGENNKNWVLINHTIIINKKMKTFDKILLIIVVLLAIAIIIPIKQSSAYNYNGTEYNIVIPENIKYLEHCYFSRTCELSEYESNLIKLNILLIKNHFTPLYK